MNLECRVLYIKMHNFGTALVLHHAAAKGHLEDVRYLVENKKYNPLLIDYQRGIAPFHVAAITGNVTATHHVQAHLG